MSGILEVVPMAPHHVSGAVALQQACFPPPFPEELLWSADHLGRHIEVFPRGQFVVLDGNQVVASASATLISEEVWQAHLSWEETVGGPYLETFDPDGSTLYGLDISVHPDYRGRGIAKLLYERRFGLVRDLGLARYGTACRVPGYREWSHLHGGTVEAYVESVGRGEAEDRTLTPLLRIGCKLKGVLHRYMEDEESDHAAALLEWVP